ncbi:hypothetical protein CLAFUW4_00300 [Fulvia fulva]|uniref:Uncharacterized protein n=1 Tax=Passalora fulva TaxID=5499 RepID=A0A9Q8L7U3_PASFU|nr:uncharacterized protein CLAFUR5_00300 [Fulvia fulva]KAK4634884.1 hypothetical protein CLAFUR4_00300 [Fulvia fulva]KAK4637487.1 hypothetical protein CLAFUR0_00301 [Fulvia fulva]UJO12386.1 hypothetical protein CLAFUR5_00300 [Fulvia fulva]WPV10148.1 hypothetical protein CLAFUW4_00300 [Fulvia fulva]WPV25319.1 hypothetical protein CLAFUW7_00304 [Fulvia fulva]
MKPHYGLIIAVGVIVLTVLIVAMAIIVLCPGQLEDQSSIHTRPIPGLPLRHRRFRGHRRRHRAELAPLLEDHGQAASIPFPPSPDLESLGSLEEEPDVAAPNNARPVAAKPDRSNVKSYQAISEPLPRPKDEHVLEKISEEGSSAGLLTYDESVRSQQSDSLNQEQQNQGNERLKNHRKLNDMLEESAAAASADDGSSSSSDSSSSSSSRSDHVAHGGHKARSGGLAGHSIGGQECHCALCLARLQAT